MIKECADNLVTDETPAGLFSNSEIYLHLSVIFLRNDSSNYYKSSEELLDDLEDILENKIEPKLLNLFHKKPSAELKIQGIQYTV